jgi:hypothetical protein
LICSDVAAEFTAPEATKESVCQPPFRLRCDTSWTRFYERLNTKDGVLKGRRYMATIGEGGGMGADAKEGGVG